MAVPLLALDLIAQCEPPQPASAAWRNALGLLCYGEPLPSPPHLPCAAVPLPILDGRQAVCELWRGRGSPNGGAHGDVHYREDGSTLFGCLSLDESTASGSAHPVHQVARRAYEQLFATADALGYPHLVRCWNYLADINGEADGLERYRHFNLGRGEGFVAAGRPLAAKVPAACALGTTGGPLIIAFLAAREAPLQIENPRQVSAYDYPPEYGPRSPTFARAVLLPCADGEFMFVSGTASIVGHRTLHIGDAAAQTDESLANLRAVISAANAASRVGGYYLHDLALKVYVRDTADFDAIRARIAATADAPSGIIYLQADICRRDLLVEIEATAHRPLDTGATPTHKTTT